MKLIYIIINLLVTVFLLILPYYIFGERLYIGGDDTRLFYAYPKEFLQNLSWFSWNSISSLPSYLPNHHSVPFLAVWSALYSIINSKLIISHLAFSLPLILGFIYFQKFIKEIIGIRENLIAFVAASIFVFSPITVINQVSVFLTPMWLIALFPIVGYYYLRFVKDGKYIDILKIIAWSVFLSIAFYTIPWVLGLVLPISFTLVLFFIFVDKKILKFLKRTVIFTSFVISSQLFWLFPFLTSFVQGGQAGLGDRAISASVANTFSSTVVATATGNVFYPMLTFFHRQIAVDFNWQVADIFLNYYDKILPLSLVFVAVLIMGSVGAKNRLKGEKKKIFVFFFVAFLISLYLFTVNIGFLKNIFLFFGYIPGFAMFRNFYDKFAPGYIFIYSSLLALCFVSIKTTNKKYFLPFIIAALIVVAINFVPVKNIVNSPLWTTENIYKSVNLSEEYLSFVEKTGEMLGKDKVVFQIPQNIASYAIVTEENGKNAYVGTSPFRILSGVNDLTGGMSYFGLVPERIKQSILEENYDELLALLSDLNVGYMIHVKNIPGEIKKSYLYEEEYLEAQDEKLINETTEEVLLRSSNNNYILYSLKNSTSLFSSDANISYEKISPVEYVINVNNLNRKEKLIFRETFHSSWKLHLTSDKGPSLLMSTNSPNEFYGNEWILDPQQIPEVSNSKSFTMKLYFTPQNYFYMGIVFTAIMFGTCSVLLFVSKKRENV